MLEGYLESGILNISYGNQNKFSSNILIGGSDRATLVTYVKYLFEGNFPVSRELELSVIRFGVQVIIRL